MRPQEFLNLAKELIERDEASCLRTAIGRAYYATFNAGRECQLNWGFDFFQGSEAGRDHALVALRFIHSKNNDLSIAGQKMRDLRSGRRRADYDMGDTSIEKRSKVETLVNAADRVMVAINQVASETVDQSIITEIEDWQRKNPSQVP